MKIFKEIKQVPANFDRFDICEAYYLFFSQWHNGQTSIEYQRLSKMLGYFKPSPLLRSGRDLTPNGFNIYCNLIRKNRKD